MWWRILKFSESSYTAPQYIKMWEEQGKRGDRVLMRGLHTGGAVITVKPSDPVYKVCVYTGCEVRVTDPFEIY